ncbi:protein of unknown function [Maridesulfovibrio hydrothermalis AM13 = DSM 14728]|uniref:Uncharacterized protein n=1 Tax=Maridesulfovibrio hydrothermalis AM13 = DSM 14728 TaxID=1121451 RepID=L0RDF8_9BACT|nr:protein of unknown function [Maridesulfovibrio hydrothermalis AM13 = DSM 14728]
MPKAKLLMATLIINYSPKNSTSTHSRKNSDPVTIR